MKKTFLTLVMTTLLVGCASDRSLYYWDKGQYRETLYQHMNESISPDEEIQYLNKIIVKAKESKKGIPPGVYAQLGMVYSKQGNLSQAREAFNQEKLLFPESTYFIDYILNRQQSGTSSSSSKEASPHPTAPSNQHSKKGTKA